jgi:hypothetical protein
MLCDESFLNIYTKDIFAWVGRSFNSLSYVRTFFRVSLSHFLLLARFYIAENVVWLSFFWFSFAHRKKNSQLYICVCVVCSINFILMKMEWSKRRKINVLATTTKLKRKKLNDIDSHCRISFRVSNESNRTGWEKVLQHLRAFSRVRKTH